MKITSVYAAIPGKEKIYRNSYGEDQKGQRLAEISRLKAMGLEVYEETREVKF